MPSAASSDYDKLQEAIQSLLKLASLNDILDTFGISTLPTAQRYGIVFGCMTFILTISAVMILLVFGGSFRRIQEQEETGGASVPDAITARTNRPLLLERLLDVRERMMKDYNSKKDLQTSSKGATIKTTVLMKRLLIISPDLKGKKEASELIDEDDDSPSISGNSNIPEGYEQDYISAYRKCQDKPGGAIMTGHPEARFEAYARAHAGCGIHTSLSYRRSYARMYEAISCTNHTTFQKFEDLYTSRPMDITGRTVRLEPIDVTRHAKSLHDITSGAIYSADKSFDPNLIWGFLDYGPFNNVKELSQSPIFQLEQDNEACFAIIENVTDKILGVIQLTNDDPKNLSIQIEPPIVKPSSDGTVESIEACFLLLDKLFALGYRRIQLAIDSQDAASRKLPGRLGFTQEGLLAKHKIVKESNRDSFIYSMLNSDWDKGARAFLYKKLHGLKAQQADEINNLNECEKDEQERVLAEQKMKKDTVSEDKKKV